MGDLFLHNRGGSDFSFVMYITIQVLFDGEQLLQRHHCRNSQVLEAQGTLQGKVLEGYTLVNELWQGIQTVGVM